jgi:hypothetical protein
MEQVTEVEKLLGKARIAMSPLSMQEVDLSDSIPQPNQCLAEQLMIATETLKNLRRKPLNIFARNWAAHLAALILLTSVFFGIVGLSVGWGTIRDLRISTLGGVTIFLTQVAFWIWAGSRLRPFSFAIA